MLSFECRFTKDAKRAIEIRDIHDILETTAETSVSHQEEISRRVLVSEDRLMTKKTQILPMKMMIWAIVWPSGGAEPTEDKSYIKG